MKKVLILAITAISVASIQAQPIADNVTLFGSTNGTLSSVSSTLTPYVTGNPPLFFNIVSQTNGTTILNPYDGSFIFNPTSLPASFNYNVTDTDGISNTANVTIIPGPMMSTGGADESEAG